MVKQTQSKVKNNPTDGKQVKQTQGSQKKKKKQNPIYASADSSNGKAKTEISNKKPSLKKKTSLVIHDNVQRTAPLSQTRATLQQPTEHIGHRRSKIGPIESEIGHARFGLDSFLALMWCLTTLPHRPPCSLKVFHLYTSLSFSLLHDQVNGFAMLTLLLLWFESLRLSISLSFYLKTKNELMK